MNIKLERRPNYIELSIEDSKTKNSLGLEIGKKLDQALEEIHKNMDNSVRALILKAAPAQTKQGQRVWISGGNLKELNDLSSEQAREYVNLYSKIGRKFSRLAVPVIAVIEGKAIGGGAELALWCDLRVFSKDASLTFKQTKVGLATGYGGASRLVSLIGLARAQSLLITGIELTAESALNIGLATAIEEDSNNLDVVLAELISTIEDSTFEGISLQKEMLNLTVDSEKIDKEHDLFKNSWKNSDHENFLTQFFSK
jgi:enoyl-CoA hydratase/carnithine racemase